MSIRIFMNFISADVQTNLHNTLLKLHMKLFMRISMTFVHKIFHGHEIVHGSFHNISMVMEYFMTFVMVL